MSLPCTVKVRTPLTKTKTKPTNQTTPPPKKTNQKNPPNNTKPNQPNKNQTNLNAVVKKENLWVHLAGMSLSTESI
jgi:hypothetical protein